MAEKKTISLEQLQTILEAVVNYINTEIADVNITCDSALSTTSPNAVQNKVITVALNGKADTSHTHNEYATTTALNNKLDKSGGTLTGTLTAQANTNYTTYQVRNIALNTTAATPTGNGSILGVYTA